MSLDIGEIGVRVQVRDPNEKAAPARGAGGCGNDANRLGAAEQDELVRQCVALVLAILDRREAR